MNGQATAPPLAQITIAFSKLPDGRWCGAIARSLRHGLSLRGDQCVVKDPNFDICVAKALAKVSERCAELPMDHMPKAERPLEVFIDDVPPPAAPLPPVNPEYRPPPTCSN